jgi:hypothetical protein
VTTSERDRLRFVAAAEHARIIGTTNPCGLFVRLVWCGLWSFLKQDDEDAASARLKRHLYGKSLERPTLKVQPASAAEFLSEDALIVRSIRAAVARAGYQGDAFPLLKRQKPEWSRERWDQASAELIRPCILGGVERDVGRNQTRSPDSRGNLGPLGTADYHPHPLYFAKNRPCQVHPILLTAHRERESDKITVTDPLIKLF